MGYGVAGGRNTGWPRGGIFFGKFVCKCHIYVTFRQKGLKLVTPLADPPQVENVPPPSQGSCYQNASRKKILHFS